MCVTTGVLSLTVIPSPPEIKVTINSNLSITLNCTYRLDTNEYIDVVHIKKKTSSGDYNDLIRSTERGTKYTPSGEYLRNRFNIYGINTESSSAALIINDIRFEDDGQYQCELEYVSNNKPLTSMQNTTVYIHGNHFNNCLNTISSFFKTFSILCIITNNKFMHNSF